MSSVSFMDGSRAAAVTVGQVGASFLLKCPICGSNSQLIGDMRCVGLSDEKKNENSANSAYGTPGRKITIPMHCAAHNWTLELVIDKEHRARILASCDPDEEEAS